MSNTASTESYTLSFTLPLDNTLTCTFSLDSYPLELRSAFGTSHSSSTRRENALLTFNMGSMITAYGEAGLPPKKTGCYEATYSSMRSTLEQFQTFAEKMQPDDTSRNYDPFAKVPAGYFIQLRKELAPSNANTFATSSEVTALRHLFFLLDTFLASKNKLPTDTAWLCLMDVTLFDAWGRLRGELVCEMIGRRFDAQVADGAATSAASSASASVSSLPAPPSQPRSFYTLGMDSLETMLSNLDFGLHYTSLIKIKCDANLEHTKIVLEKVAEKMEKQAHPDWKISLDANAAWNDASTAMKFLDILRPYRDRLAMVEQPYPLFRSCPTYIDPSRPGARMQVIDGEYVDLPEDTLKAWCDVTAAYAKEGILLYADESICTSADLIALRPLLHGVNIKLEKAGGYRGALSLLDTAAKEGVHTWLGCMVGSTLNASQAAQLLPIAVDDCWGDLDGSLLTQPTSDRFEGGMKWTEATLDQRATGEIHMANRANGGCGVVLKHPTPNASR